MIFIVIYIYSYVYLCIYTPSYQHFKAFLVYKFNSETSFLYQLFKENSNFIVKKSCKVVYLLFMMSLFFIFIYTYIYTPSNQYFKAFSVSKINFKTSFVYQLFKEKLNFIVFTPCNFKLFYWPFFINFIIIYIYSYVYLSIYTPLY